MKPRSLWLYSCWYGWKVCGWMESACCSLWSPLTGEDDLGHHDCRWGHDPNPCQILGVGATDCWGCGPKDENSMSTKKIPWNFNASFYSVCFPLPPLPFLLHNPKKNLSPKISIWKNKTDLKSWLWKILFTHLFLQTKELGLLLSTGQSNPGLWNPIDTNRLPVPLWGRGPGHRLLQSKKLDGIPYLFISR